MHMNTICWFLFLVLGAGVAGAGEPGNAELLADAAARTTTAQARGDAGHDGKFFLATRDGRFRLNVSGQSQVRYHLNFRDTSSPDEDITTGFNMRRAKIGFDGVVAGAWNYKLVGAFDRNGGAYFLEDFILSREWENGVHMTWGQFKAPFLREENVSSKTQLAVDRSTMNEVFNQDRTQGIQLAYEGTTYRVKVMVSDGFKTINTTYTSTKEADWALTGRVEFKFGEASWKTHKDFTSFRGGTAGGMVGGAVHWQTAGNTGNTDTFSGIPATETDMLTYTLDASYEGGGWNLYGAFVGRRIETTGSPDYDDFGALLQGGAFLSEKTELFARWDAVFPDDSRSFGEDFHTLTLGANHYFFPGSHAAKLTADVQWYLDDQVGSGSVVKVNEGIGLMPTTGDDQISFRLQMQILF